MMINGPPSWASAREKSNRAAIAGGWGPTLRLVMLRLVAPSLGVGLVLLTNDLITQLIR